MMGDNILKYIPFKSFVGETFWHKLSELKLDVDRLDDKPRNIYGFYTNFSSKSCLLEVDYSSFNNDFQPPKYNFTCHGILHNTNTVEEFKNCDKIQLINEEGKKLINDIKTGVVLEDPTKLTRFFVLSFADLKTHNFYYWFAIGAVPTTPNAEVILFEKGLSELFLKNLETIYSDNAKIKSYFILKKISENEIKYYELKNLIQVKDLSKNFENENLESIYFCFSDPSDYENSSWLLRLYVTLLNHLCPQLQNKSINFLAVRISLKNSFENSIVWKCKIPKNDINSKEIKFVGWEQNQNGKMGPRIATMGDTMDPVKIAETSMNLNLKLMKWRIVPNLNLDIIQKTKVLLFGAGTLGCAVARNLLSWGFNTITIIDNGRVNYGNPARQCLYTFHDAKAGNKMKATTAAENLKNINPICNSKGYVLQIPMPGHTVGEVSRPNVEKDLDIIEEMVKTHDVLFLLTDSRESRWLPTLLGSFYKKIVINSALGFDSYLVMRHGSHNSSVGEHEIKNIGNLKCIPGSQLGCYFCNDVTAPGNSLKDRTLDQQCTVTRPGVSNIAASYAVELLVSLLQNPLKDLAPAYYSTSGNKSEDAPQGDLGLLPHSIRGMLNLYENILPATSKFPQCIACSEIILNEYQKTNREFLFKVFESTKYLEDLTGISEYAKLDNDIIDCQDDDWSD